MASLKFKVGDFVVSHDYRRGWIVKVAPALRYWVLWVDSGRISVFGNPSTASIDLSGVEPTDEECAVFAAYMLKNA